MTQLPVRAVRNVRRQRAWIAAILVLGGLAMTVFNVACGPPPEGWSEAGRRFDLPEVVSPTGADAGPSDTGSGNPG